MKLQIFARAAEKKSEAKKIRREGNIPAVIYSKGDVGKTITVKGSDYHALIRSLPDGRLSTCVITLTEEGGQELRVIVKDIEYHVTTYDVLHLDFEELHDDTPVSIKVPIECTGVDDCVGIKLGGVLRQVVRQLKVRCLPKDIPTTFELAVEMLDVSGAKRLSDIAMPETVRPMMDLNEVAIVIAKG